MLLCIGNLDLLNSVSKLIERYEYTPYGQRTIFSHGWNIADINNDGKVSLADLTILSTEWGSTDPTNPADLNGGGNVGLSDLTILSTHNGWPGVDNDPLVTTPVLESPSAVGGEAVTAGLCDIGHQGLLHDKEFGLINNRNRYLSAKHGRYTQQDPAGYTDGANLYEYVRSNPVGRVDPFGKQSAAQAARAALATINQEHAGYMYYEGNNGWLTGLKYLISDKLIPALSWLDDNDFKYGDTGGAAAMYDAFWNDVTIQQNPDPYDVFHEAIHVYNDWVDKYDKKSEERIDEGLTHAAQALAKSLKRLQNVEKRLSDDNFNIEQLKHEWGIAWNNINGVNGSPGYYDLGTKRFTVNNADLKRLNSHLGFKVKCKDIADLYNSQPDAKKACVEFLCSPNAKPTKGSGWTAVKTWVEISSPFK